MSHELVVVVSGGELPPSASPEDVPRGVSGHRRERRARTRQSSRARGDHCRRRPRLGRRGNRGRGQHSRRRDPPPPRREGRDRPRARARRRSRAPTRANSGAGRGRRPARSSPRRSPAPRRVPVRRGSARRGRRDSTACMWFAASVCSQVIRDSSSRSWHCTAQPKASRPTGSGIRSPTRRSSPARRAVSRTCSQLERHACM